MFADNGGLGSYVSIGHLLVATPDEDNSTSLGHAVDGRGLSAAVGDAAFAASPAAACFPNCYLNRSDFDQDGGITARDISRPIDILVLVNGGAINGPGCGPDGANNRCPLGDHQMIVASFGLMAAEAPADRIG